MPAPEHVAAGIIIYLFGIAITYLFLKVHENPDGEDAFAAFFISFLWPLLLASMLILAPIVLIGIIIEKIEIEIYKTHWKEGGSE